MRNKVTLLFMTLTVSTFAIADNRHCVLTDGINIETNNKRLLICENNKIVKEFKVAIGNHGIGKKIEGDKKTPLGLYPIGLPRKSDKFGMFIPIQYPTPEQIKAGFTGKNVGIHGPIQAFRWFGPLNTWSNWTYGCVAVGNNSQISYIAKWVEDHPNQKVFIR